MWPLPFISEGNFLQHIEKTIRKYGGEFDPFDLKKFNKNLIDPVKLIFDKSVYKFSREEIVKNEIFRQRDKSREPLKTSVFRGFLALCRSAKSLCSNDLALLRGISKNPQLGFLEMPSNNNDIGYFHQRIFQYIEGCQVLPSGWDVVFSKENGVDIGEGEKVGRVFVEMKNKHNAMNSSASSKTYMKMQSQLLSDDNCACFLVEVIAKQSQNIPWAVSLDGIQKKHRRIRRASIDKFYSLVTGQEDAFYQMCMILPDVIEKAVSSSAAHIVPKDSVIEDLDAMSKIKNSAFVLALLMLGFSSYNGFRPPAGDAKIKSELENIE